jgi:hypothetical protein
MALNPDFRDLFASLNGAGAEYLVIGAYALAVHGAPMGSLKVEDLHTPGIVFQMGLAPNRIDLLTSPDGVVFDTAWVHRVEGRYGDQSIPILGRAELIQNTQAAGRTQDLADIEALRRMEG